MIGGIMNNPLTDVLSPGARKMIYFAYALVGLGVGAVQAGYGSVNVATPDWLKITLAVYAFVGTFIGATAASNVKASAPVPGSAAPTPGPAAGSA
ncbi:MAG: hypothetical protein ACRDO2_11490 [Nocardioidaceae bacterium]